MEKEKVKSLRMDDRLYKRIVASHRKHRPYLKSQNYFIVEMIEVGLDQLDRESKLYRSDKK